MHLEHINIEINNSNIGRDPGRDPGQESFVGDDDRVRCFTLKVHHDLEQVSEDAIDNGEDGTINVGFLCAVTVNIA